jgi:hypothetical protein
VQDAGKLADTVASHLVLPTDEKQVLLETPSPSARLLRLTQALEIEVERLDAEKREGRAPKGSRSPKEHYLSEKMKTLQKERQKEERPSEFDELKERIEKEVMTRLQFVLNNLHEGDLFNVIAYDSEVEAFRPELQQFGDETRRQALAFVEGLFSGGGTNIHAALTTALGQLQDSSRPTYLFFLTDGLPTEGETNEAQIAQQVAAANRVRARMLTFGVGFDVNSRLLDKLARENFGQSEFVRPNEDIEAYVSRLYRRVQAPVLVDVKLDWQIEGAGDTAPVNRLYPREVGDLFAGDIVPVARASSCSAGSWSGRRRRLTFRFPWRRPALTRPTPSSKSCGPRGGWARFSTSSI